MERVDLRLHLGRELESESLCGAVAAPDELAAQGPESGAVPAQDRGRGLAERVAVTRADSAHPRHVAPEAAETDASVGQGQHPMKGGNGQAHLVATQIWAEVARVVRGLSVVDDAEPGRAGLPVHAYVDGHLLPAARAVPVRQCAFKQVALEPCRLVLGVAGDRLNAHDAGYHL